MVRGLSWGAAIVTMWGTSFSWSAEPIVARRLSLAPPANVKPTWQPSRNATARASLSDETETKESTAAEVWTASDREQAARRNEQQTGSTKVVVQNGLRWRVRAPGEFSTNRELTAGPRIVVQPVASTAPLIVPQPLPDTDVRQVAHETAVASSNPFNDPFGDRLVQQENNAGEEPPMSLEAPTPPSQQEPRSLRSPTAESDTDEPAAPQSPLRTSPPSRKLQTPSKSDMDDEEASPPCDHIYNDRDCCAATNKCKATRKQLSSNLISSISLDITPRFKPDAPSPDENDESREARLGMAPSRRWRNRDGEQVAEGRFMNYTSGRIEIAQVTGGTTRIPFASLSDDDMCFVAAWWGTPTECALGDDPYVARNWEHLTMTWKASALCHKPLYFEETQLERYGHTTGPITQPVLSGAHFFLNIATLPYHMGINPMNECQYALGYYRPGSCAPWLVPPIPLSLRGGLMQAGAVVGGIYVLP